MGFIDESIPFGGFGVEGFDAVRQAVDVSHHRHGAVAHSIDLVGIAVCRICIHQHHVGAGDHQMQEAFVITFKEMDLAGMGFGQFFQLGIQFCILVPHQKNTDTPFERFFQGIQHRGEFSFGFSQRGEDR